LACVLENTVHGARHCAVDIGIGQHHEGRLASQLQQQAGGLFCRVAHDVHAGSHRAGKGYVVHTRVANQRSTRLAARAGDHIDDPRRNPRSLGNLRQQQPP